VIFYADTYADTLIRFDGSIHRIISKCISCIVRLWLHAQLSTLTPFPELILQPLDQVQTCRVLMSAGKEADSAEMARAHSAVSAEQVSGTYQKISICIRGIAKLIFSILYL